MRVFEHITTVKIDKIKSFCGSSIFPKSDVVYCTLDLDERRTLEKRVEKNLPTRKVGIYRLLPLPGEKLVPCGQIMKSLEEEGHSKSRVSLAHFCYILGLQTHRQEGVLQVDGHSNFRDNIKIGGL